MPIWTLDQLEFEVRKAVAAGKFKQNTAAIEEIILGACVIFLNKALPENISQEINLTDLPNLPLAINPRGRPSEVMFRNIVFASLFRAWMLGKDEDPIINNKGYPASPFVVFAEPILEGLGIGKVEDHLEEFRSYRKKAFEDSGFTVTRGRVN